MRRFSEGKGYKEERLQKISSKLCAANIVLFTGVALSPVGALHTDDQSPRNRFAGIDKQCIAACRYVQAAVQWCKLRSPADHKGGSLIPSRLPKVRTVPNHASRFAANRNCAAVGESTLSLCNQGGDWRFVPLSHCVRSNMRGRSERNRDDKGYCKKSKRRHTLTDSFTGCNMRDAAPVIGESQ